jgi:PAS domain S-box-containing protein
MLGYEPEDLVGRPVWDFVWPEDRSGGMAQYAQLILGEIASYVQERRYQHKDGHPLWCRVSTSLVCAAETGEPRVVVAVIEDIDARHKAVDALEHAKAQLEVMVDERTVALRQRDILLREVYHRVKNNLQIIDSFLVMQRRQLEDPDARAALLSLRNRVYALGLVHHQLMESTNLRTFDIAPFLAELSDNILKGDGDRKVELRVKASPMDVGLDFAIPLGLLVTELVTNALKHAFVDDKGTIEVTLDRGENGDVTLVVADDGRGLGDTPRSTGARAGLGTSIIAGLVAQLRGTLTMQSDRGTRAEVRLTAPVAP